jgi:hypothetical protein
MFNKYKRQHKKTQKAIKKFGITSEEAKASFGLEVLQLLYLIGTDSRYVNLEVNYNTLTIEIHIPEYSWQLDDYMSELQKVGEVYALVFK